VPTRVIWLHGRDVRVHECTFEAPGDARAAAAFEQVTPYGVVRITLPRAVGPGRLTLYLAWDAAFTEAGHAGLFRWRCGGEVYVIAGFLSVDARRAFPGFDEPRFKTPFDVSVTVSAQMVFRSRE
jgi:cytosol alanyl aminopeptidase